MIMPRKSIRCLIESESKDNGTINKLLVETFQSCFLKHGYFFFFFFFCKLAVCLKLKRETNSPYLRFLFFYFFYVAHLGLYKTVFKIFMLLILAFYTVQCA